MKVSLSFSTLLSLSCKCMCVFYCFFHFSNYFLRGCVYPLQQVGKTIPDEYADQGPSLYFHRFGLSKSILRLRYVPTYSCGTEALWGQVIFWGHIKLFSSCVSHLAPSSVCSAWFEPSNIPPRHPPPRTCPLGHVFHMLKYAIYVCKSLVISNTNNSKHLLMSD